MLGELFSSFYGQVGVTFLLASVIAEMFIAPYKAAFTPEIGQGYGF